MASQTETRSADTVSHLRISLRDSDSDWDCMSLSPWNWIWATCFKTGQSSWIRTQTHKACQILSRPYRAMWAAMRCDAKMPDAKSHNAQISYSFYASESMFSCSVLQALPFLAACSHQTQIKHHGKHVPGNSIFTMRSKCRLSSAYHRLCHTQPYVCRCRNLWGLGLRWDLISNCDAVLQGTVAVCGTQACEAWVGFRNKHNKKYNLFFFSNHKPWADVRCPPGANGG